MVKIVSPWLTLVASFLETPQLHETQRIDLVGIIHTFLTVLRRQRGRKGEGDTEDGARQSEPSKQLEGFSPC